MGGSIDTLKQATAMEGLHRRQPLFTMPPMRLSDRDDLPDEDLNRRCA